MQHNPLPPFFTMKLSDSYKEQAFALAATIGKLEEIYDRLKYTDEKEAGNYFPSMALYDAFKPLACALANTVVYWQEYAEGDCKDNDKDLCHLSEEPESED